MIGALRGTLLDRDISGTVVVDVNGVGYEVQVTATTLSRLGDLGTEISLRVHTRVREDSLTLYGFPSADEKRAFDILIATHGVGPSVALAMLSAYSPLEMRQIVAMDDADALARVPGIGKKTAARMLVELKSKFDIDLESESFSAPHADAGGAAPVSSVRADVIAALSGLGYDNDEIRMTVADLPAEGDSAMLLRTALRALAQRSRS